MDSGVCLGQIIEPTVREGSVSIKYLETCNLCIYRNFMSTNTVHRFACLWYIGTCVCMSACVRAHVCQDTCMCAYVQRPQVDIGSLTHLTEAKPEPRGHRLDYLGQPACSRDSCLYVLCAGIASGHHPPPSGDRNSSRYTCMASVFTWGAICSGPALQPYNA